MTVIYKKLQYNMQFGWQKDGENFGYDAAAPSMLNRHILMRFSHVEIPAGSIINSATLYMTFSAKNNGDYVSFNSNMEVDGVVPSQWLDASRPEWRSDPTLPWRNWTTNGGAPQAVSFTQGANGEGRYVVGHNVGLQMNYLISRPGWSAGGGSVTFKMNPTAANSNLEYVYASGPSDGWSPMLVVDFTPPASDGKSTVVNIQENATFARSTNAAGAFQIAPYGFTDWFGGYAAGTPSVTSSLGTEVTQAPPSGGSMARIAATTTRFAFHFGVPRCEEGKWYNYSCWTWQPLTNPANMSVGMTLLGDSVNSGFKTDKGVWVRHDKQFQMDDAGPWAVIETGGSGFTWDSNCIVYVAGVQLTEGRMLRPWIGGNKTLTGADYGWAGITGSNGFVRAVPPTVSVTAPIADKSIRKYYAVNWTYAQGNGHVQNSSMVKVRKVR